MTYVYITHIHTRVRVMCSWTLEAMNISSDSFYQSSSFVKQRKCFDWKIHLVKNNMQRYIF